MFAGGEGLGLAGTVGAGDEGGGGGAGGDLDGPLELVAGALPVAYNLSVRRIIRAVHPVKALLIG